MSQSAPDPWAHLRAHTAARIALGRAGVSLPTQEWLRFGLAHAAARDAVHLPFAAQTLATDLQAHGFATLTVHSAAPDRATYLTRPDLGRRLSDESAAQLRALNAPPCDVAVVVGDGLSARGVHAHAVPLLLELRARLEQARLTMTPVLLAHQCRVALGDEAGNLLRARAVVMLIGERPGLSSPDSLGAYLTWAPQPGRLDSQRNCVSNIRAPEGLGYAQAAHKIAWLLTAAVRLGATGVALKDESDLDALADSRAQQLH
ncbi:MAG: ethanolamine ammonia-lyase subunit EutC [Burkholderiaceae bacterium]